MSLVILRGIAVVSLILLVWNPSSSRILPTSDQPIVLLDASLSMNASWQAALDSVRPLARRRAVVWRFGRRVAAFDSLSPSDGATRLGPALEAAAGRAGEVVVVTDGALDDAASIPPDLLRRPRVILLPRAPFFDAYVASVAGTRHVTRGDTVRLRVSYGTSGTPDAAHGKRTGTIVVRLGDRQLLSQRVSLPDSGTISTELPFPVSRIPSAGWSVLEVSLDGIHDTEPRDDKRLFAIDVSLEPAAVIFASPPDWEARFLARTLRDVARMPVKMFVETEAGRWRDAASLAPVATPELIRAAQNARLVVLAGNPERSRAFVAARKGAAAARLSWLTNGQPGDWYVERPLSSPLTAALSGVVWDSLPPATAGGPPADFHDSTDVVALTARLARRGAARPIVVLEPRNGERRATITAGGLWRWAFRGGASEQAYRSLVAALVDWLLGTEQGARSRERAIVESIEVPNGMPLVWRWSAAGAPQPLQITLRAGDSTHTDTLRFDAAGRAELLLPLGVYRYALSGGSEQGVVAVETYSDEWLPRAPVLTAQPGEATARLGSIGLRDRWWLFVITIAALAAEWTLRRRQGLP
ncbi:MAG TPA: vWA domain-containing protein [Gemmatimonadales bacterium]|nr:vWA domain-containing protein [Gemmatimonadales bacterium]